jgi:hypothetical protein
MKRRLISFTVWVAIFYVAGYLTVFGDEVFTLKFFLYAVVVIGGTTLLFDMKKIEKWVNPRKEQNGPQGKI